MHPFSRFLLIYCYAAPFVAPPAPPLKDGDRLPALGGAVESKMPATPSESEAETELVYKIMVVGNAACGKTSIINRFVNNVFSETCAPRLSPAPPPCCRSRPWPHCPDRSSPENSGRLRRYKSTVGADFSRKIVQWDERTTVRLQLWDIAGQDRFGPPPSRAPGPGF